MWSFDPWCHEGRGTRAQAVSGLLVLALATGCTAPTTGAADTAESTATPQHVVTDAVAGPPRVLATVGGQDIHIEDVAQDVAMQVWRRQVDIYSLLKREAERVAEERIISAEAERQGLTEAALLKREVDDKVVPATEEEVTAWLAEHPREAAMGDVARPRVAFFLAEQRRQERRLAFLEGLRSKAGFEMHLEAPVRPRVQPKVDGAPVQGPSRADVDLVYFGMPTSPEGARTAGWIAEVMARHPDRIRLVHRPFLAMQDEVGLAAALIGYRAQDEGRYWDWYDQLRRAGEVDREGLLSLAQASGLDRGAVEADLARQAGLQRLKGDITAGLEAGVETPPVVFVNGDYFSATYGEEAFRARVEAALAGAGAGAR